MRLSELIGDGTGYGPIPWARQVITNSIAQLGTEEDPVIFETTEGSTQGNPKVVVRVFAALTGGLLTATVTTSSDHSEDAQLALGVLPWPQVLPTLRYAIAGDPEERLPSNVTIVGHNLVARGDGRARLTQFFFEACRLAGTGTTRNP